MNKISKEKLTALTDGVSAPSVTIYMPTHKAPTPPHMQEDQTRFKNLVTQAMDLLATDDSSGDFAVGFMNQANGLMEDNNFWEEQTQSLLICAQPGKLEYFNLPIDSDEYVAVDDHFHLAPLLGFMEELEPFYLLAVKQKQPFLMHGDAYGLELADLELPESIEAALNIDELHLKSMQHMSIKGGAGAQFHGHGGGKDAGDPERKQFMRFIHDKVAHFIDKQTPIILAGTTDEVAEFNHISKLDSVLPEHIHGSYMDTQVNELHTQALGLIRKHLIEPMHKEAVEQYERLAGRNPQPVETNMDGIQSAAEMGKVETLLLGVMSYTADTIRDGKERVVKLTFPSQKSRQAVDSLAQLVWKQGGRIINLYSRQMPHPQTALAINRY